MRVIYLDLTGNDYCRFCSPRRWGLLRRKGHLHPARWLVGNQLVWYTGKVSHPPSFAPMGECFLTKLLRISSTGRTRTCIGQVNSLLPYQSATVECDRLSDLSRLKRAVPHSKLFSNARLIPVLSPSGLFLGGHVKLSSLRQSSLQY